METAIATRAADVITSDAMPVMPSFSAASDASADAKAAASAFFVPAAALLDCVRECAKVATQRAPLVMNRSVLLVGDSAGLLVQATDGEACLSLRVPCAECVGLRALVEPRALIAALSAGLPKGKARKLATARLEVCSGLLTVTIGESEICCPLEKSDERRALEVAGDVFATLRAGDLVKLLASVTWTGDIPARVRYAVHYTNGLYLELRGADLLGVTTDGHALASLRVPKVRKAPAIGAARVRNALVAMLEVEGKLVDRCFDDLRWLHGNGSIDTKNRTLARLSDAQDRISKLEYAAAAGGAHARALAVELMAKDPADSALVDLQFVPLLRKLAAALPAELPVTLRRDESVMWFELPGGAIGLPLLKVKFPPFERVLPEPGPTFYTVACRPLADACARAYRAWKASGAQTNPWVRLEAEAGALRLRAEYGAEGIPFAADVFVAEHFGDFNLQVNPQLLLDAVNGAPGTVITLHGSDEVTPIHFRAEGCKDWRAVLMPIRPD